MYAVIDLVALSNDPSGNNFPELTWQINYQSRLRTASINNCKKNIGNILTHLLK